MVWETGHWILVCMVIIAVLSGIMPMIGSLISKEILNELQNVIVADATGVGAAAVFWGSMAMSLLIFFFIYKIINQLVSRINIAVTRIAGEKVVRYVKLQIMEKAKQVDIASFDIPEFYEKLENANREAGMRPISVLSSTFDAISHFISIVSYVIILASAPGMWWTALVMLVISFPSAIINFTYRKKHFIGTVGNNQFYIPQKAFSVYAPPFQGPQTDELLLRYHGQQGYGQGDTNV